MPPKAQRYPSIRYHRPTEQYFTWDGVLRKRVYLGKDVERARVRLAELRKEATPDSESDRPSSLSVNELLLRYVRHKKAEGADGRTMGRVKTAARFATRAAGELPATSFRALALQSVRKRILGAHDRRQKASPADAQLLSRRYVNHLIDELKRAWKWAASIELVPAEVALSLQMVKALRKGKGGRETIRVPAVEPWVVEATLPELSPVVAAMVRLQLYAGCRPGELCKLRPRDISTSPKNPVPLPGTGRTVAAMQCGKTVVWMAVPESHKTFHRGKPRAILLGPKCQEILKPFLDRGPDKPLFSPREAVEHFRKVNGRALTHAATRMPGEKYTTQSYGNAVEYAINRVNRKRSEQGLDPIPDWRPNQLRHRAGTDVSEAFDRPTAAAFLGHAGVDVIDVYVDQELAKAAKAAAKMG